MRRALWLSFVFALSAVVVVALWAASAGSATTANRVVDVDPEHASEVVERGTLPVDLTLPASAQFKTLGMSAATVAAADPPLGTVRAMPVLDDVLGTYRIRGFTLRGIGQHIEVWVQQGTAPGFQPGTTDFPAGDCRNDGVRNVVTDAQIASLINEFDTTIYPKESATFSVPPSRDGMGGAVLPPALGLPDDYYAGDGSKIVTLVSNVRDDNYYDKGKSKVEKYIDRKADFVAAIVFYDDPAETSLQYAPYTLTVNGVTQPGGS